MSGTHWMWTTTKQQKIVQGLEPLTNANGSLISHLGSWGVLEPIPMCVKERFIVAGNSKIWAWALAQGYLIGALKLHWHLPMPYFFCLTWELNRELSAHWANPPMVWFSGILPSIKFHSLTHLRQLPIGAPCEFHRQILSRTNKTQYSHQEKHSGSPTAWHQRWHIARLCPNSRLPPICHSWHGTKDSKVSDVWLFGWTNPTLHCSDLITSPFSRWVNLLCWT